MSKRTNRKAADRADAELRALLAEQDARWQARQEQDRQRTQMILSEARNQVAQDKLEAEAVGVENYRKQAIAQATSSKTVAPQFLPFGTGSSREEIDAQIERAEYATAELVSELAGQGEPTVQSRDEATGRFIPQQPAAPQPTVSGERGLPQGMTQEELAAAENGTLDMTTDTRMRDRLGLGHRDAGIFG
jgi:hypothetical protein